MFVTEELRKNLDLSCALRGQKLHEERSQISCENCSNTAPFNEARGWYLNTAHAYCPKCAGANIRDRAAHGPFLELSICFILENISYIDLDSGEVSSVL